jgi:tetratricopeptide (TPR) repeat protein
MTRNAKILSSLVLFIVLLVTSPNVIGQNNCACAVCSRSCNDVALYGHIKGYSCFTGTTGTTKSMAGSSEELSNIIAGAIFQNVLTSIFNNASGKSQKELDAKQRADEQAAQQAALQAAEQQRINAAIAQAEYEKMMRSYKLLDNSQNVEIKTLNTNNIDFKTLDGDTERLRADAGKQFENTSIKLLPDSANTGNATPFFGNVMPMEDIQTLINPQNNPEIVDLMDAKKYVVEKINTDSTAMVSLLRKFEPAGNGEPIIAKPDCKNLSDQLKAYVNQRQQFQKTIDLSQNEVDVWETANRNALVNAAKDGLEYYTGQWLEKLSNRGKAADRLQRIYDMNEGRMAKDGIDIAGLKAKIETLRNISSAGQIAELSSAMNDWQTFIKDGMSSLISQLSGSNAEINKMIEDPKLKIYFETDKPELNALLDISKLAASNMVFGKWVARKIPLIACVELSIKELYNGTDYLLSLNRIIKANQINGKVTETARGIQKNIDDTYSALSQCR